MKRSASWYTITAGNLDETTNKLTFSNNLDTYNGDIMANKKVSGGGFLSSFSMEYKPSDHK